MGNNDKSSAELSGGDENIAMHLHPDLATRERHLNELIMALRDQGVKPAKGSYVPGYYSINPNSELAAKDGCSLFRV